MTQLPAGTLTFLFTDIEGSTRLWEENPEAMRQALTRHDALLRDVIESHGGHVFKTTGDGFCAVFSSAARAAHAALAAQLGIVECGIRIADCPDSPIAQSEFRIPKLRVRMALHTGQAERRDGDYFGPTLCRVARLLAAGHGGQILLSGATQDALEGGLPARAALKALGVHRLRDLQHPERIFQLLHPELPGDFAPLRTLNAPWIAHHSQASSTQAPPWFSRPAPGTRAWRRAPACESDRREAEPLARRVPRSVQVRGRCTSAKPAAAQHRDAAVRTRSQSGGSPWSSRRCRRLRSPHLPTAAPPLLGAPDRIRYGRFAPRLALEGQ